ncbi:MAG: sigma 54-interacting transcriptional regulator [Deltaproteobacteria bacterium]|nr:sigma 54-interacting transcriptional regulator [Deltaproteobacteria bacterium]
MERTLENPPSTAEPQVRLLVSVLHYDDLLADRAKVFTLRDDVPAVTLGRASSGDAPRLENPRSLVLPDRWTSERHCALERVGDATVVRDLGSRNGTWVNGLQVSEHRLADGDLLEAGHGLFCYRKVPRSLAAVLERAEPFGPTRTCCPEVAALWHDLARVAPGPEPVLLLGETGTGKEIVAQAIHRASGRPGAFRAMDCGAIAETLFEATLFGHRKGAFTGAVDGRQGEIALAHRGTLLLDEVANMSLAAQASFLRVIEDARVTPVGGTRAEAVDVRWLAATNADLLQADTFRQDLLRRLAGYVARLPPLRRRREDLGVLASHLLREAGVPRASIAPSAARALFASDFPGNARQLRTMLRAAVTLAGEGPIEDRHLPRVETPGGSLAPPAGPAGAPDRDALEAALAAHRGNVVQVARSLGTHPRQVYRWIERLGLSLDRFRV